MDISTSAVCGVGPPAGRFSRLAVRRNSGPGGYPDAVAGADPEGGEDLIKVVVGEREGRAALVTPTRRPVAGFTRPEPAPGCPVGRWAWRVDLERHGRRYGVVSSPARTQASSAIDCYSRCPWTARLARFAPGGHRVSPTGALHFRP